MQHWVVHYKNETKIDPTSPLSISSHTFSPPSWTSAICKVNAAVTLQHCSPGRREIWASCCSNRLNSQLRCRWVGNRCFNVLIPWAMQNSVVTLGDFTFWLRLSLRLSLSLNFGLSTYLSQKVKWFRWAKTWRVATIYSPMRTDSLVN